MATLRHKKCWVSICSVTLHNLCGHLEKDKLVHRSADDLRMHMPIRQPDAPQTSWTRLLQAAYHCGPGRAASCTPNMSNLDYDKKHLSVTLLTRGFQY